MAQGSPTNAADAARPAWSFGADPSVRRTYADGDEGHHWRVRRREFFIPPEAIKPGLAPGRGLCFATDRITVDGYPVGYMYREKPDWPRDSGWRFLAGNESRDYIENADNLALYDVNIIANFDPEIIPFLDAPLGSAFERHPEAGMFEAVQRSRSAKARRRGPRC